jgi:CheY-like chemotaxis protein
MNILIVDDDEPTRLVLSAQLRIAGATRIRAAADGEAGLALARAEPPDLIVLDLMMPGRTGQDVCRELQADPVLRGVRTVVLSAADSPGIRADLLEAGADDFLSKPCSLPEIRATLARAGMTPAR